MYFIHRLLQYLRNDKYAVYLIYILLFQIILFYFVSWVGMGYIPIVPSYFNSVYHFIQDPRTYGLPANALYVVFPSDAQIYLKIATHGYRDTFFLTWFPGYPFFVWLFNLAIQNIKISALLVSNLAASTAFIFLYRLLHKQYDSAIAFQAVVLLSFFPYSFYFHTGHSEGLFFLWTVLAFYYWDRKKYLAGGVISVLATLTRPFGIIIPLVFFIDFLHQLIKKTKMGIGEGLGIIASLFLSPAALLIYGYFNFMLTGDFLFWLHNRALLSVSGQVLNFNIFSLSVRHLGQALYAELITFFSGLLILIAAAIYRVNKNYGYMLFGIFLSLVPILMNNLLGYGRFLTAGFPLALFLVLLLRKFRWYRRIYLVLILFFILNFIILSIYSANWYFVA